MNKIKVAFIMGKSYLRHSHSFISKSNSNRAVAEDFVMQLAQGVIRDGAAMIPKVGIEHVLHGVEQKVLKDMDPEREALHNGEESIRAY